MRFLLFVRHRFKTQQSQLQQNGFTLIELLLVISLLAVLAVAAIAAFDGNEEQARDNITRIEMVELQKALLQFRRDNRELPCLVYVSSPENRRFTPFISLADFASDMERMEFASDNPTNPSEPNSLVTYAQWCSDSLTNTLGQDVIQSDNALSMLHQFPFALEAANSDLLWSQDTQSGWNGPYISQEALTDGWGNPYKLLDPELAYSQRYRCADDGSGGYDMSGDVYNCLPAEDITVAADYPLAGDIARIASSGPNGIFESATSNYTLPGDDPCIALGDDLVQCLLR
ncbi:MAG: type II secretion system protein GspG [Pseudomonadota bacterium]|nr:type II secretion system protein GspG [Pseudomonadota bacterium]